MNHRDLTHAVESGMPVFPGDPEVRVDPHATHEADGYRVSAVACGSHTGTHVDAPSHTEPDGRDVDALGVDRFVRDAVRVDCRGRAPRAPIGADALPAVDADLLVVQTGWDDHWGEDRYVDHPYLTADAAAFCADRGYDVAVDALNVDPTPTDDAPPDEPAGVPAHHALLGDDRLIFENLTGLAGLPDRFEFLAFPLNLAGGDGAPVRAVARYE
ncbi:cyclase family protein [Candidatus Halobonum tyrrellensis]|uniref:Putative metal-dependent hydrolase n=1 Tax=Candidatus Halobonum tyrrellensis G22 TaxID=1324957 RepID=V4GNQ4_9EURY|nr:cyclase family protein [Candidatus Halobonum tyrrellensis]ESP87021.1 putative metal-dependent hydrolase [Candidatus Halobonum tyrrellensis G22]